MKHKLYLVFLLTALMLMGGSAVWAADAAETTSNHNTYSMTEETNETKKIVIMSIGSERMVVNNDMVQNDSAPLIQNGRTYVPLRALSNIFDAQCNYDSAAKQITITKDDTVIIMTIDEKEFTVNGETKTMDAPAYINENGRTMVPVRFIANTFGAVIKLTFNENGAVADIMLQL